MSFMDQVKSRVYVAKTRSANGTGGYEADPYKRFQLKVKEQIAYIDIIKDELNPDKPKRTVLWFFPKDNEIVYKVLRSGLHFVEGQMWYNTDNLDTLRQIYLDAIDAADNDPDFRQLLANRFAEDARVAAEKGLGKGRPPKKEEKAPKAKK